MKKEWKKILIKYSVNDIRSFKIAYKINAKSYLSYTYAIKYTSYDYLFQFIYSVENLSLITIENSVVKQL